MRRRLGYLSLLVAAVVGLAGAAVHAVAPVGSLLGPRVDRFLVKALLASGVLLACYGGYLLSVRLLTVNLSRRRAHDGRNVLRLAFGVAAVVSVLGVLTEQWVGLLLSLGIVGFAATFALQQPLLSLLGWAYIAAKSPYGAGDRVRIGDAKGDVIRVDFLVTTIWEVGGELVSTNQPSGRVVTVPNSVVLSREVVNFGGAGIPYVWNELSVQVAYETDLEFARERMRAVAGQYLGDEMASRVSEYRRRLDQTPVELEVGDGPTVNVRQGESWVELRLRYLVHPRRGTRVRNELYERVLAEFNEHPDRVKFPVGRNR